MKPSSWHAAGRIAHGLAAATIAEDQREAASLFGPIRSGAARDAGLAEHCQSLVFPIPISRKRSRPMSRRPSRRWPSSAARTRRRVQAMASTPVLTPLLLASSGRVWHAGTWVRRHLPIGAGVTGGARAGDRTGHSGSCWPAALPDPECDRQRPRHGRECHSRIHPEAHQPFGRRPSKHQGQRPRTTR